MYSVRGSAGLWVDMLLVCYSLGIGVELETAGETGVVKASLPLRLHVASRKPGCCQSVTTVQYIQRTDRSLPRFFSVSESRPLLRSVFSHVGSLFPLTPVHWNSVSYHVVFVCYRDTPLLAQHHVPTGWRLALLILILRPFRKLTNHRWTRKKRTRQS